MTTPLIEQLRDRTLSHVCRKAIWSDSGWHPQDCEWPVMDACQMIAGYALLVLVAHQVGDAADISRSGADGQGV